MADPLALAPLDDLRLLYGLRIQPVVVPADVLREAIAHAYDAAASASADDSSLDARARARRDAARGHRAARSPRGRRRRAGDSTRERGALRGRARRARATSTSNPSSASVAVRMRVDGVLHDVLTPPLRLHAGARVARQDHGRPRHRGAPPAPGRPHHARASTAATSTSASPPCPRSPARAWCCACSTATQRLATLGDWARHPRPPPDSRRCWHRAQRHHPGHRPHRLRQDDHALRAAPTTSRHQRAQHRHHRGPGRVPARRHRPDAGQRRRSA